MSLFRARYYQASQSSQTDPKNKVETLIGQTFFLRKNDEFTEKNREHTKAILLVKLILDQAEQ